MVKDDLWSDPTDEFSDVEVAIEPVKQKTGISANNAIKARSSKTVFRKVILKKVAEPQISTIYLSGQSEQGLFFATIESNISILEPAYQNHLLPTHSTTNHEDKTTSSVDIAGLPSAPRQLVTPKILTPAPIISE